jgi:TonB family protein
MRLVILALGLVALLVNSPLRAEYSEAEIEWRRSISAQVDSQKDYPVGYFGDGGTTRVTCVIDRTGHLTSVDVTNSSGSKMLDDLALDMFRRAQPFRAAPDEAKGSSFKFAMSISFDGNHPPVDVELVIAADVSFSMGKDDLELRRDAYAEAIGSDEFAQAVKAGPLGKIAVTYFEWSGANYQTVIIPRREIDGPEAAAAFAAEFTKAKIVARSRGSISKAIEFAVILFRKNHADGARQVLDISSDGPNNDGGLVRSARDAALAKKITINGVTIMFPAQSRPQEDIEQLDDYFADCVVGGPGSFVLSVTNSADLKKAIRTALVSEVAGKVPEQAQTPSAAREKRVSCQKGEERWARMADRVFGVPNLRPPEPGFEPPMAGKLVAANEASRPLSGAQTIAISEAVAANVKKCVRPARTGPTIVVWLNYKPDGTYRVKPLLINAQDNEEYTRTAAWVIKQIDKCPPVKFPNGASPRNAIRWEFSSEGSAKSSRR